MSQPLRIDCGEKLPLRRPRLKTTDAPTHPVCRHAQSSESRDAIWPHRHSRPRKAQSVRLLVHGTGATAALQPERDRQASDTAAHYGDGRARFWHQAILSRERDERLTGDRAARGSWGAPCAYVPLSSAWARCHDRGVADPEEYTKGDRVRYVAQPVFDLIIDTGEVGTVERVEGDWVFAWWPRSGLHGVPVANVESAWV